MAPESAAVAQWELAIRLRERRKQLGMSSDAVARAAGFTRSYWSSVENDRNVLTEEKLNAILDLLEADKTDRRELLALRATAMTRGWWTEYASLCEDDLLRLFGMEYGARSVRVYQNLLFPSLLQCEPYTRRVVSSNIFVRPAEVDRLVRINQRRQERLTGADPLRYTAVISQAALLQQIGGPELQRTQLRHVVDVMTAHRDTIDIRILPFTAAGRGVLGASTFQLIDFPSSHLPTMGWHETVTFHGFIDDPVRSHDLDLIFDSALSESLDRADSLALIAGIADEI